MPPIPDQHDTIFGALTEPYGEEAESLDSLRRRTLLREISREPTTRKRLAARMKLRAGTVTDLVGELIADGLVRELEPVRTKEKGRPEIWLAPVSGAVGAIVVQALADRVGAYLTDLSGQVIESRLIPIQSGSIEAGPLLDQMADLVTQLKEAPGVAHIAGLVVSLPGIVNESSGEWLFSSRYAKATPLSVGVLAQKVGLEVHAQRALSAELEARLLRQNSQAAEPTVLLHWGYGIGMSAAYTNTVQRSTQGAFGEIGHWRSFLASTEKCQCGEVGCLETQAALWSMVEPLKLESASEESFAARLVAEPALADDPLVRRATNAMAVAMRDVYLLLFPNLITITGPFVQSPVIYRRLVEEFYERLPPFVPKGVRIEVADLNANDEIFGAAKPTLHRKLRSLLDRRQQSEIAAKLA